MLPPSNIDQGWNSQVHGELPRVSKSTILSLRILSAIYIPQRGVQWKEGVVIHMPLYTSLLYNTTPIHCTPLPLHPPLMNTQGQKISVIISSSGSSIKIIISIIIISSSSSSSSRAEDPPHYQLQHCFVLLKYVTNSLLMK